MIDNYSIYNGKKYEVEFNGDRYFLLSETKDEGFVEYVDYHGEVYDDLYCIEIFPNSAPPIHCLKFQVKYMGIFFEVSFGRIYKGIVAIYTNDNDIALKYNFERFEKIFFCKEILGEEIEEIKIEDNLLAENLIDIAETKTTYIPKNQVIEWLYENIK